MLLINAFVAQAFEMFVAAHLALVKADFPSC